jgi:hypothetical protein
LSIEWLSVPSDLTGLVCPGTLRPYSHVDYPRTGTGEHGVGIGKKEFLVEELGEGTINLMKAIKRAVDPLWLFNPGKVNASFFFHLPYGTDVFSYLAVSRWRIFSLTRSRGLEAT